MGNLLIMILFIGSTYGFIKLAEDIARLIYGIVERTKRNKAEKELEKALDDIIGAFIEHEETQQDGKAEGE